MNCAACGSDGASFQCGKCKNMAYCGRECQKSHWKVHKKICCVADQPVIKQGVDKTALPRVLRLQHPFLVVDHSTLPELGLGLFTNKAIKAGTNLAVGNAIAANKAISNATNDAVLPDFVTLFSKSASQAQKDAAWQRYMTASKQAENINLFDDEHMSPTSMSPMVATRDIAAGEELFACFGFNWFTNLRRKFMETVSKLDKLPAGMNRSRIVHLVDLPAGCKLVGVMLDGKVLVNSSKKNPADLLHLTAEEVGHWINEMDQRARAALRDPQVSGLQLTEIMSGLTADESVMRYPLTDVNDPVFLELARRKSREAIEGMFARTKAEPQKK